MLKLIITNGVDVANVTSLTRGPTQAMRYALLWTSPTCTVEGCSRTIVEHDHRTGAEYRDTKHTRLDEIDRVCPGHHDLHTNQGWALVAGTGKRPMVPPDNPRHPQYMSPVGADAPTDGDGRRPPVTDPVTGGVIAADGRPDRAGEPRPPSARDGPRDRTADASDTTQPGLFGDAA